MTSIVSDQKIYQAAILFSEGAPGIEVINALEECMLESEVIEVVTKAAAVHGDPSTLYRRFLEIVNEVLGQDIE